MMEKIPRVVGKLMHGARAGSAKVLYHQDESAALPEMITVSSPSFAEGSPLDPSETADGARHSPALAWSGVPAGATSLVLLAEDADSPTLHPIVHTLCSDLPARDGALAEGALGERYRPPDPPTGHGPHRNFFQFYALRRPPAKPLLAKSDLIGELKRGNGAAKGCLMGTYERK